MKIKILTRMALAVLTFSLLVACYMPHVNRLNYEGERVVSTEYDTHRYYDSVGILLVGNGPMGSSPLSGTAFAVTKDILLTAGHVCERYHKDFVAGKASAILVALANGKGLPADKMISAQILSFSEVPDICILWAPNHSMAVLPITNRYNSIRTGDPVLIPGAPMGVFPITRDGRVAALKSLYYGRDNGTCMLISAVVEPGNSGSPVIWKGEVVGIVVKVPGSPRDTGLAESAPTIIEYMEKALLDSQQ